MKISLPAALLLASLTASTYGQCTLNFAAPAASRLGVYPTMLAVADINRDGKPDLVYTTYYAVGIALNDGTGGFSELNSRYISTGFQAGGICVGDFNRDGLIDIAVTHIFESNISIFLGLAPNGVFAAPVNYPLGTNPSSVVTADFNRDGILDLAITNNGSNTVSVLRGNANGTFQAAVNYAAGTLPDGLTVLDLDGNGVLDLAVVNQVSNNISVLFGNGSGGFAPAANFPYEGSGRSIASADLNGDGTPDLVTGNGVGNSVSVLMGNRPGLNGAANFPTGLSANWVTTGDLNSDGKLDIIVANAGNSTVSVLRSNGSGGFLPAINITNGISEPTAAVVADFNGDGRPDLAVSNYHTGDLTIYMQLPGALAPTVIPSASEVHVVAGMPVNLSVNATIPNGAALSYTWRRNGASLTGNPHYAGQNSPSLSIPSVAVQDAGSFDCIVSTGCTSTMSDPVSVIIEPACPADFNEDGVMDFFDYLDFVSAFSTGC